MNICGNCNGMGVLPYPDDDGNAVTCPECDGTGINENPLAILTEQPTEPFNDTDISEL